MPDDQELEKMKEVVRRNRFATIGTGRRDGSPQLSLIMYNYDGYDIMITTNKFAAKYKNAKRNPKVAMSVVDGRTSVVVYGRAELNERMEKILEAYKRLFGREPKSPEEREEMETRLRKEERCLMIIHPEKFLAARLDEAFQQKK